MTQEEFDIFHEKEPDQKANPYIWTYSGQKFYLNEPTQDSINLRDIAWACSKIARWNGHLAVPWSVAQHQILVRKLLNQASPDIHSPDIELTALMHDAGEAYYGDISSPVKQLFPQFRQWCKKIDATIAEKFGLIYPWPMEVVQADRKALEIENLALMRKPYPGLLPEGIGIREALLIVEDIRRYDSYAAYLADVTALEAVCQKVTA